MKVIAACLLGVLAIPALAQQSSSFNIRTFSLNAGGSPSGSVSPGSASFMLSFEAIGDAVSTGAMFGAAYRLQSGVSPAAQANPAFDIEAAVLNSGGSPLAGAGPSSASFRISLDAIGDPVSGTQMASVSYRMQSGTPSAFPPPGEVVGLHFSDPEVLLWTPERSVGSYNVYRGSLEELPGLAYGVCHRRDLPEEETNEPDIPGAGEGFFYLVTVRNRLSEEGTKGYASDGSEREGVPCP